jgi:hypothetical protein
MRLTMTESPHRSTNRARFHAPRWLAWLLVVSLAGCGDDTITADMSTLYPVKGKVLLPDGKPLTEGGVEFIGLKAPVTVSGKLGPDGSFSLGMPDSKEGAPAGEYRVRIVPGPTSYTHMAKGNVLDSKKLPYYQGYLDEDASGLTAVVEKEDNLLEPFRLTKKAGTGGPAREWAGGGVRD